MTREGSSQSVQTRVPAAEVAERPGHTVAVLLKVYTKVLDGQQETSNKRIDDLHGDESQTDPY